MSLFRVSFTACSGVLRLVSRNTEQGSTDLFQPGRQIPSVNSSADASYVFRDAIFLNLEGLRNICLKNNAQRSWLRQD